MIVEKILALPRNTKRFVVLLIDMLILPAAIWCSFSLRLGEFFVPVGRWEDARYLFFLAPIIAIPIFIRMGLYRAIVRYIGFNAMWAIVKAVSLYTLIFGMVMLLAGFSGLPRSVLLINWLMTVLLVGGTRALARWWLIGNFKFRRENDTRRRVVIYGAGSAGRQTAAAFIDNQDLKPVAFLDDNKTLKKHFIRGLKVYSFTQLSSIIEKLSVTEVLLAMPSIPRSRRRQIIAKLESYPVHVTTLPGMNDLASGKVKIDDIREVDVQDLLGRTQVKPDQTLLNTNINGKVVMVTGAGGSIGSELCRQIVKLAPTTLILYERSESDLYHIENELIEQHDRAGGERHINIVPILASINNKNRLLGVCRTFYVQTIYHAAAYKHVPMVEKNPSEAVRNNSLGTYTAATAAIESRVETFVLISTDKAVRPTSTMGATKRFAEMILQGLALDKGVATRFTMVRFGNVLDSSGSVVPRFRKQIAKGGPITVTDPGIIRYFMTIPEAAQLVIQAGALGQGGDVFVLDMGEPIKILDMAKRLVHLSGLEIQDEDHPDGDIKIVFTGLRPGEKLYEELLIGDDVKPTKHPLIMTANEHCLSLETIEDYIGRFEAAVDTNDVESIRLLLLEAVNGFIPQSENVDLVNNHEIKTRETDDTANVLVFPQ
ncbi:MAG: polysaccharide biosynthesis protein [Planctomycetaceae bacterium]|nr:polysaccharide biosynthesis protein [Planctomycetaceae bacterium]